MDIWFNSINLQPTEEELKDGDPTERAGLYEGDIDMAYHEVDQDNSIHESNPWEFHIKYSSTNPD